MEHEEDIFEGLETLENVETNVELEEESNLIKDNFLEELEIKEEPKDSLIDEILKSKGIDNSKISILDEDGSEKEVNFYDLTTEEQLEILFSNEDIPNENLDDSEIELINHLRTNNLSVDDFLKLHKESIIAELQQSQEVSYDIDAYNDHELFLLDLKNKFDLTDEELQLELEKELKNEDIFNKKITKLRTEYKQLEDQNKASKQAEFEAKQQEEYDTFTNGMIELATAVSDFHGVFLEDDEKQETLSYLLELDDSGMSKFSKDLNDPNKLYEAAWYLRYGKEAFQALENAYEAEIVRLKAELDKPRVVVQNSKKKPTNINDLNF